mmetsp:Transcript_25574/g.37632  ORF Transcript_25574/g.37632 Transcript_25574/m.37632 type:complete len:106 (+) Transcript_25574:75-392(+)|eukprot:CAMPEP_0195513820 /NCGR_PEP_ID=MMETSP0794_2-20130614/5391_1 /TAXON_ID=515487 /ORGANISM="Stephanopyxis turris, Strain CCMP 815" /LENGTH=105 /DNA_ID=CAMNT_0040641923 /DNA_START=159 /DNA_END=476 /DNA_ORIENTATION=+
MSSVDNMTAAFKTKHEENDEKKGAFLELVEGVRTTPRQQKFPAQNQAPHCWNRYNEWVLCLKTTKGDEKRCSMVRQYAVSICPDEWVEKWDTERDEKLFPGIKAD